MALASEDPERRLFMAVPLHVHKSLFSEEFGRLVAEGLRLNLVVFDHRRQKVTQWIE
jgi:hypothetical protein